MCLCESEISPLYENELGISLRKVLSDDGPFSVGEDETDLPTPKVYGLPKHESSPVLEEYERKGNAYERKDDKIGLLNCHQKSISIFLLCVFLIDELPGARSLLVMVPNNTVVLQSGSSETIRVSCQSDQPDPLRWYVKRNPISEKQALYNGYYLDPDAKSYCTVITDEPGAYHLLLKKRAEIAQTYICFEPGTLAEASADIIWIGSDLVCSHETTTDHVILTCNIEFRGNWAPTMEWKEHSNSGEEILTDVANTVTVPDQGVISTLIMPVQRDSRNYTCTAKFDVSGNPLKTTASNVPDYNQNWSHTVSAKSQDEMATTSVVIESTGVIVAVVTSAAATASFVLIACLIYIKLRSGRPLPIEIPATEKEQPCIMESLDEGISRKPSSISETAHTHRNGDSRQRISNQVYFFERKPPQMDTLNTSSFGKV